MRVLVPNPIWPHPAHSPSAANVIIFELLRGLRERPGVEVSFLKLSREGEPLPNKDERAGLAALTEAGIEVVEPFLLSDTRARLRERFSPSRWFYPNVVHRRAINDIVSRLRADVVLVPLSEMITPLFADAPAITFAYYGNPDPKVRRARLLLENQFRPGFSKVSRALGEAGASVLQYVHHAEMKKYNALGNVAANDASYYSAAGHPNAFYVPNVWIKRDSHPRQVRSHGSNRVRIVGNVGRLSATANSFGLALLVNEYLDEMRSAARDPFTIDVYGAGKPYPRILSALSSAPEINMRGFVSDIDSEIVNSDVFLCLNNASPFKVCHTRYLHAWSLGKCVVAHEDARLSIPELQHGENALLGKSIKETAELTLEAGKDRSLAAAIGQRGYETFLQSFSAKPVAMRLVEKMEKLGGPPLSKPSTQSRST